MGQVVGVWGKMGQALAEKHKTQKTYIGCALGGGVGILSEVLEE